MMEKVEIRNFMSLGRIELDLVGCATERNRKVPKRFVSIYGANGCGKTSFIRAVHFLRQTTRTLTTDAEGSDGIVGPDVRDIAVNCLMVDGDEGPSVSIEFRTGNGDRWRYELSFGRDGSVIHESLDRLLTKSSRRMFAADRSDGGLECHLDKDMFGDGRHSKDIRKVIDGLWGNHTLLAIFRMDINGGSGCTASGPVHSVLDYLDSMVIDVPGTDGDSADAVIRGRIAPAELESLGRRERALSKLFVRVYPDVRSVHYDTWTEQDAIGYELYIDRVVEGKVRSVPAILESSGTRKLMGLFHGIVSTVAGADVLIDEIDTGMHDILVNEIMDQLRPDVRGQLIITTHNLALLAGCDPKDTYVIDTDMDGRRRMLPLYSILKTQRNHNICKLYREGYYGGVPRVGTIAFDDILATLEGNSRWPHI